MTVEERSRRQLQEALMDIIGPEQTDTLLGYLPPVGWADVATARDLQAFRAELRGEIAELRGEVAGLRTELRGEIAEWRGEVAGLRTELRGEIAGLRTDMRAEVSGIRADMDTFAATLRGEMHRELRVQFYSLATLMTALLAIAVTLSATGLFG